MTIEVPKPLYIFSFDKIAEFFENHPETVEIRERAPNWFALLEGCVDGGRTNLSRFPSSNAVRSKRERANNPVLAGRRRDPELVANEENLCDILEFLLENIPGLDNNPFVKFGSF